MQPQQPAYSGQPAPSAPNQYDFIVNYGKHPSGGLLNTSSLKGRILLVVGGGTVLLLIAVLFAVLLSGSSSINTSELVDLAQRQAELARISKQPMTSANTLAAQNLAASTRLSMMSEEQALIAFLARHGTSLSGKALQARKDAKTDAALQSALSSGTYDQTYISIAQTQLGSYALALKQAYAHTKSASERQLLSQAYADTQLLLQQSGQPAN